MDQSEPNWRMNSSFSPPPSSRWNCMIQSDGSPHEPHGGAGDGSSFSARSKGNMSVANSDQHSNHYSISDGSLSYYGSPTNNFQVSHWTPPQRRYDLGEFSTPAGGARPEDASVFCHRNKRQFPPGVSSVPNSIGSSSSPSESNRWASTSKQPIIFPPRNLSGRRSFMSKPVYPLVFRNPVSDGDPNLSSRIQVGDSSRTSPLWPGSTPSPDLKFHKTLNELDKLETFPEAGSSSRREGFRWSNASSYDFGYDADSIDVVDHVNPDNLSFRCSASSARYQKCSLCERLLCQKSPWSSNIMRNGDMPIAAILACGHVFHAECLEETTPKAQAQEPPCPLCTKLVGAEGTATVSEPLQLALRSVRRKGASNFAGSSSSSKIDQNEDGLKQTHSAPLTKRGSSLLKDHLRKKFSFKGKRGKDLFSAKAGSSSSSSLLCDVQTQSSHLSKNH